MNISGIPNILTAVRIILVPFFVAAFAKGNTDICAVLFVISGISDVADGFIARHFSCESNVGKILDPIADKLTYASAIFCLCSDGKIPLYFVLVYAVIQIIQGIGAIVVYKNKGAVVKSNAAGKVAGFSMFALCFFNLVFYDSFAGSTADNILCAAALAVIVCATTLYFIKYITLKSGKITDISEDKL